MKKTLFFLILLFVSSNKAHPMLEVKSQDGQYPISVEAQNTFVQLISALMVLDGLLNQITTQATVKCLVTFIDLINFLNDSLQNRAFLHAALNHARTNNYSHLSKFLHLVASSEETPLRVAINLITPNKKITDIRVRDIRVRDIRYID